MEMANNSNSSSFESKIGRGTKVSGKLHFDAPAKIEGEVEGEISASELIVAEGAVVKAHIAVGRLTVAGSVSGEIVANERVELVSTARVRCTISTPKLVLNEGALFDGDCKMPRDRVAA
jgi:cytoskeletal protein CcmA (bactofilin family)